MSSKYVFGPIASRRLGVSLGVDLVNRKTCTQDCPYCEAGWTTNLTLQRAEYVPVEEVIAELRNVLSAKPQLDYITFSGAGEPTLNSKIGEVIKFLKTNYPQYKVCVLTNGTLLGDAEVASSLALADLVVPDLDGSNEEEFRIINRPAAGLTFDHFVDGLKQFCRNYHGLLYLELFVAPGINDSDASIARFADIIKELKITKVQLNSLDRPGCDNTIKPANAAIVRKFIAALEPIVPVEAVGAYRYRSSALRGELPTGELCRSILNMAKRRQVTRKDLLEALQVDDKELENALHLLLMRGLIESEKGERGEFFGFF